MLSRRNAPAFLAICAALTGAAARPASAQCGSENEWPCVCRGTIRVGLLRIPYPYPCCDRGYGMDAAVGFRCSSCSVGNPGYYCTSDGRGREGEDAWVPLSAEWLRTGGRLSDRGLIGGYNFTRHTAEISAFKGTMAPGYPSEGDWGWRALRLQEQLEGAMPIAQAFFPGTHNSFNNTADGYGVPQHSYSMSDQLDMGIRKLNLDVHVLPRSMDLYREIRLSHANNEHLGGSGVDRPYRHAIEEIATWVSDNPDAVVILELENRAAEGDSDSRWTDLVMPLEQLLGNVIFRPSTFQGAPFHGSWSNVTRDQMKAQGKRVIICVWHSNSGDTFPARFDIGMVFPSRQSWRSDGTGNSVMEFMRHYQYDPGIRSGGLSLDQFDAFEANTQELSFARRFGNTTPTNVRAMVKAGVNFIGMEPIGISFAGDAAQIQPFEPLMEACVWSWAEDQPPEQTGLAAKVVRTGREGRMHAAAPNTFARFATVNATGSRWSFSSVPVSFTFARANAGPDFRCPGNGLQMQNLIDDMENQGINEVWVNYQNIDSAQWTAAVRRQQASLYVATNGNDSNSGLDPSQPLFSIHGALARGQPGDELIVNIGPGTYTEFFDGNATRDRTVVLQGSTDAPTIINAGGSQAAFTLEANASVTLRDLTVTNARGAAALAINGSTCSAALERCTITGNFSTGIGTIYNLGGSLTIVNSTISGNTTAFGPAINCWGSANRVIASTIASNANLLNNPAVYPGGIWVGDASSVTLSNTIVAGNTGSASTPDFACRASATPVSLGYNLIGRRGTGPWGWQNGPGDLHDVDPLLAPLALQGGTTATHALLQGSPARDAGNPSLGLPNDQRSMRRNERSNCAAPARSDIGAVESEYTRFPANLYVSPCGNNAWTGTSPICQGPNGPKAHIQAAIDAGCPTDYATSITVAPGSYHELLNLNGRHIDISSPEGPEVTIIDGSGLGGSVVTFANGEINTRFDGFTITGGSASSGGGIFIGDARPIISRCVITGNHATLGGGACLAAPTSLGAARFFNCKFIGNTSGNGAGVYAQSGGGFILSNCLLWKNRAGVIGGAAYGDALTMDFYNCTITGNSAGLSGGGVHHNSNCVLVNTIAWANSGADIESAGGHLTALNSNFPGSPQSDGNLRNDPIFIDAVLGDFRLAPISPCIDAGGEVEPWDVPGVDVAGKPRDVNLTCAGAEDPYDNGRQPIDMGCYEAWDVTDWDNNGIEDFCDIAAVPSRDCNHNGILDLCEGTPWPQAVVDDATGYAAQWVGQPDESQAGLGNATVTFDLGAGRLATDNGEVNIKLYVHQGFPGDAANWDALSDVLVSADGINFVRVAALQIAITDQIHGFGLWESGVRATRYIRLVGSGDLPPGGVNGFRLDAVTIDEGSLRYGDPFGAQVIVNTTGRPASDYTGAPDGPLPDQVPLAGSSAIVYDLGERRLVNGPNADLTIYAATLSGITQWFTLRVDVSADGKQYFDVTPSMTLPVRVPGDGAAVNAGYDARSFDLGSTCLSGARYVRLSCSRPDLPPGFAMTVDALGLANVAASQCAAEDLYDCNHNGRADLCDIADRNTSDCNSNNVPDACEAPGGFALSFNGVSSAGVVPHSPALNTSNLTLEAWIKPNRTDGSRGIINKYSAGSYNGYNLFILDGHLRAWFFRDISNCVYDGGVGMDGGEIEIGVWQHVALTIDDTGGRLYVNGILRDSMLWTGQPGPTTTVVPLHIGHYQDADPYGPPYFDGLIDEVRIWNIARTSRQVASRMGRPYRADDLDANDNAMLVFHFSEGAGNIAGNAISGGAPAALLSTLWRDVISCCPADFNRDHRADSQDFFDFLAAFFGNLPIADVNHDNAVNSQDFFDFLGAFFTGC